MLRKRKKVLPGFGCSIGITVSMLSLVVLIPLLSLMITLSGTSWAEFLSIITDAQTVAAYRVSLSCAAIASSVNVVFGVLLAWILTRYQFRFRRFLNGIIELPFALPTSVAGIALTNLYSDQGWLGAALARVGIKVAYTTTGIVMAMIFVGIPFVVRSIQPVLETLDTQYEEAAAVLGASRYRIFCRVIFPEILPTALVGFGLAFSRSIGEYGSVVFIAGNIPYKTQITPLVIMNQLEQFHYVEATSIALVMVAFAFLLLFMINLITYRMHKIARG